MNGRPMRIGELATASGLTRDVSTSTRTGWSEVEALTSAGTVAATILCCLPFATGIVGASVAAVGARFVPFQPYLIAVSLGLLAYAAS
jgi:uncharacterized membrane protein